MTGHAFIQHFIQNEEPLVPVFRSNAFVRWTDFPCSGVGTLSISTQEVIDTAGDGHCTPIFSDDRQVRCAMVIRYTITVLLLIVADLLDAIFNLTPDLFCKALRGHSLNNL